MANHAQSSEHIVLDGLSFKFPPTADYVTARRSVTLFPQGGNEYSTSGVRVLKITLTGDQWLDPSTVRLMFKINNTDPVADHQLRLLGGGWSMFRRVRVLCGGQIL